MNRVVSFAVIISLISIGIILKFKFLYYLAIFSLVLNFFTVNYLIAQKRSNVWMIGLFFVGSISAASFFHHSVYFVYSLTLLYYSRFVYIYGYETTINKNLLCNANQINRDFISENVIIPLLGISTVVALFFIIYFCGRVSNSSLMEVESNKFTLKEFIKDPFDHSMDKKINTDMDKQINSLKTERIVRSISCGDLDLDCYNLKIELIKKL